MQWIVLRASAIPFALAILVDERNYAALAQYVNGTNIGQRLIYYRTGFAENAQSKLLLSNSLFHKLTFKDCAQQEWLRAELQQRFNYLR